MASTISSSSDYDSTSDSDIDKPGTLGIKPYQLDTKHGAVDARVATFTDAPEDAETDRNNVDTLRLQTTDWCSCNSCDSMPYVSQCICCNEMSWP